MEDVTFKIFRHDESEEDDDIIFRTHLYNSNKKISECVWAGNLDKKDYNIKSLDIYLREATVELLSTNSAHITHYVHLLLWGQKLRKKLILNYTKDCCLEKKIKRLQEKIKQLQEENDNKSYKFKTPKKKKPNQNEIQNQLTWTFPFSDCESEA